jgi:uncharacterized membrane protein
VDTSTRLPSLDTLRGLVMVIMALDHVRDFFSIVRFDPLNLSVAPPGLFFTRWVTHFCAPVFIFLAGVSAYLYAARGRTPGQLALYLFTRGLWLVALELTVVHLGWFGTWDHTFMLAQVIWAIGWSLVGLAGLVALRLPLWAIAAFGLVLITGHNLLGGLDAANLGAFDALWTVLHRSAPLQLSRDYQILILYPLVPWIGVMAAGYAFGPLLLRPAPERRRWLLGLGTGLTLAFIVLRFARVYGDPRPWVPQPNALHSLFDFLNVEKYPPSLLFLLMTLGPTLLLLAWLDHVRQPGRLARFFSTFGRVPLFYYVLHLLLIRALAGVLVPRGGVGGYELPGVYLVWLGVVGLLWPVCALFARLKQRHRAWWVSYL